MAKDWEFKETTESEPRYEQYAASRGCITLEVWVSLEGEWYANATVRSPVETIDGEIVYMQLDDSFPTRELAQLAIIDHVRKFVEMIHADFRGAE